MKKYVPILLASALALPVAGFAAHHASAQGGPRDGQCDHGGPGEGHHHGRGGGDGWHGRGGPHGGPRDPAERAEHRVRMLTAILDLNERQATEVRRILTAEATEMQTLMQQGRSPAMRDQMQAIHDRTQASIEAVLNPQQRATLQRMEAVRRQERAEHEAQRGPAGQPPAAPAPAARPTR